MNKKDENIEKIIKDICSNYYNNYRYDNNRNKIWDS